MKKISDYFDIAFENENFIAINKPSNLSTQKNSTYDTSVEEILENYTPFSSLTRFGIVHRLDRDTTGILIIAKNQKYQKRLLSLFKEKKVEKNYLSLNFGKSLNRTGIIKFFLKKHFPNGQKIRMKFGDFNDKLVEVKFEKVFENSKLTLFDIKAETGRTHQIRLAFESIGLPIYNDPLYNNGLPKDFCFSKEGQYLHSYRVCFLDDEKKIEIIAKLPKFFSEKLFNEGVKVENKIISLIIK